MGFELPFELDTLEAIRNAHGKKELIIAIAIRVAPFVLYLSCALLEYFAFDAVNSRLDISCIKHHEISSAVEVFLFMTYPLILPDLIFAILGPFSLLMIYNNPYGVAYNAVAGLVCLISGIFLNANMTFCGNPGQDQILIGPILLYICAVLHIGNSVLNHFAFTKLDKIGEKYFGHIRELINDLLDR